MSMSTRLLLAAAAVLLAACGSSTGPKVSDTQLWVIRLEQTRGSVGRLGTIYFFLRLNETTQPDSGYACDGSSAKQITTFVASVHAPDMRLQSAADGSANGTWGGCYNLFSATISMPGEPTFELHGSASPPFDAPNIQILGPDFCSGEQRSRQWTANDRAGCWTMYRITDHDFSNVAHPDAYIDIHIREQSGNDWWVVRRSPGLADSIHIRANSTTTWEDLRSDHGTDEFDAYYFPLVGQTHVYANCAMTPTMSGSVGLVIASNDGGNASAFQCTDGWSRTGP
jgi:hypothetical protein